MKIMIVDDQPDNIYMLDSLFKGNGYATVSAPNGAEALRLLKEGGADLIISDILMPVMDGFQFCQKIKSDEALKAIPFIFYTATYTEKKDEDLAMKIGADRFIVKPAEPEDIVNVAREVLKEAKAGKVVSRSALEEEDEKSFYSLYSDRLVHKLEKRTEELEREIALRRKLEEEALRRVHELEIYFKASVNREERIAELKKKIAELEEHLNSLLFEKK